eukprot:gnl/MRDRNA2_/MRDRNA2_83136_c1_seq1.p1 gnl/MRDRNA2_/MRDRNA2_83136_c1~~gnl/MRDRNA2_/MRDRNA2_83136_c1_seq1.p1  ORF type:complete len:1178 (+),score=190.93 gnl/MRDRNA2_/MRDRNA2_83136_c1_seq1:143-3535(+)
MSLEDTRPSEQTRKMVGMLKVNSRNRMGKSLTDTPNCRNSRSRDLGSDDVGKYMKMESNSARTHETEQKTNFRLIPEADSSTEGGGHVRGDASFRSQGSFTSSPFQAFYRRTASEKAQRRSVSKVISEKRQAITNILSKSSTIAKLRSIGKKAVEGPPYPCVVFTDPGQGYDDDLGLVALAGLEIRGQLSCKAVIATLVPAKLRARLVRDTLDSLGMSNTPVGWGSSTRAGSKDSTSRTTQVGDNSKWSATFQQRVAAARPVSQRAEKLLLDALTQATANSLIIIVLTSLQELISQLVIHETLFRRKVRCIIVAAGPRRVDTAREDREQNEFEIVNLGMLSRRCETLGISLQILYRPAASSVPPLSGLKGGLERLETSSVVAKRFLENYCQDDSSDPKHCDIYAAMVVSCAVPDMRDMHFSFTKKDFGGEVAGLSREESGLVDGKDMGDFLEALLVQGFAGRNEDEDMALAPPSAHKKVGKNASCQKDGSEKRRRSTKTVEFAVDKTDSVFSAPPQRTSVVAEEDPRVTGSINSWDNKGSGQHHHRGSPSSQGRISGCARAAKRRLGKLPCCMCLPDSSSPEPNEQTASGSCSTSVWQGRRGTPPTGVGMVNYEWRARALCSSWASLSPEVEIRKPIKVEVLRKRIMKLLRSNKFRQAPPAGKDYIAWMLSRVKMVHNTGGPRMRVVWWRTLLELGRIPRWPDDACHILDLHQLLEDWLTRCDKNGRVDSRYPYLRMLSHRWQRPHFCPQCVADQPCPSARLAHPDSAENTKANVLAKWGRDQYDIDNIGPYSPEDLYLWVDFAGINQDDSIIKALGIEMLPLYIACCGNGLVFFINESKKTGREDDEDEAEPSDLQDLYEDRAWTSVERALAYTFCAAPVMRKVDAGYVTGGSKFSPGALCKRRPDYWSFNRDGQFSMRLQDPCQGVLTCKPDIKRIEALKAIISSVPPIDFYGVKEPLVFGETLVRVEDTCSRRKASIMRRQRTYEEYQVEDLKQDEDELDASDSSSSSDDSDAEKSADLGNRLNPGKKGRKVSSASAASKISARFIGSVFGSGDRKGSNLSRRSMGSRMGSIRKSMANLNLPIFQNRKVERRATDVQPDSHKKMTAMRSDTLQSLPENSPSCAEGDW